MDGATNHPYDGTPFNYPGVKIILWDPGPNGGWCTVDGVDDDWKNFDAPGFPNRF